MDREEKNSGFILIATLCIIALITLLILTSMQHVLMYYKAINRHKLQQREFFQHEKLALQLANTPLIESHCVEHSDAINTVLQRLSASEGCHFIDQQIQYYYLIEDLGEFPCLVTRQQKSTRHIRVSLLQRSNNQDYLLQIRYLKPLPYLSCLSQSKVVNSGVGSWRYLSLVKA